MKLTGIFINRGSPVPLSKQLESALRDAILCGQLSPGERLLSSRDFQTHLGLARNTIVNALDQLHAEGYLHTLHGVGTFVSQMTGHVPSEDRPRASRPASLSHRAPRYFEAQGLAANMRHTVPFRPGMPALDMFPTAQFRRSFQTAAWTTDLLDYGSPLGRLSLREAISKRLRQTRGIVCSADDIVITNGAQSAFALVARTLLNPADIVIVEDPGYANVRAMMIAEGLQIFGAPVDEQGIDVASFPKRARLVFVTPSHQYPSGVVLSLERRFALLNWAAKNDAWIVEDDYDAEFNYTNRPQPALQGLDAEGRVIYAGTFSKVLSPALRIAYLVMPRALKPAFEAIHSVTGGAPSAVLQAALAHFIETGSFSRHVTRMRKVYDERRCFVRDEFLKQAGAHFEIQDSRAGLHFIARLQKGASDVRVSERAAVRGLIVPALSSYYHDSPPRNGLVIGYAVAPPALARTAIAMLSEIAKDAAT
ncbi:MAG: PLP-dependent aminotransferase family protein [Candidatus Eremiobacteraeota bacterium]|nr:PLP-dependent aminotransferase family protein [Candidatus Eremiobacteraeota bacterium]